MEQLSRDGVRVVQDGQVSHPAMSVVDATADLPAADAALLAVPADQWDSALPLVDRIDAPTVVTLAALAGSTEEVVNRIGSDRAVLGFPGVVGWHHSDRIEYCETSQWATTLGDAGGGEWQVSQDLRRAGLEVAVAPDMPSWLKTHAVFSAGLGAAVLRAGGCEQLASSPTQVKQMITAVRDGFRALAAQGIAPCPPSLNAIFTKVPFLASVPYWRRELRSGAGGPALQAHLMATRETEFRFLVEEARNLTQRPARLQALFAGAGFPG